RRRRRRVVHLDDDRAGTGALDVQARRIGERERPDADREGTELRRRAEVLWGKDPLREVPRALGDDREERVDPIAHESTGARRDEPEVVEPLAAPSEDPFAGAEAGAEDGDVASRPVAGPAREGGEVAAVPEGAHDRVAEPVDRARDHGLAIEDGGARRVGEGDVEEVVAEV